MSSAIRLDDLTASFPEPLMTTFAASRINGATDQTTRTFIYHTAFPQQITSRRDILHDFSPSSESPSAARVDVGFHEALVLRRIRVTPPRAILGTY